MRHYCPNCDERLGDNTWWCQPCQGQKFEQKYNSWKDKVGNEKINNFIRQTQREAKECTEYLDYIEPDRFQNIVVYDDNEVGTMYSANWDHGPLECWSPEEEGYVSKRGWLKVALCAMDNNPEEFLKELKVNYYGRKRNPLFVRVFGVTHINDKLLMVSELVEWDLRHYVSHHSHQLTWQKKIGILHTIACALEEHNSPDRILRDFQSSEEVVRSNIVISMKEFGIPDLGEPVPVIGFFKYDIIQFFPPEILTGDYESYPNSEIYTLGMLMWEFTANKPPFYDMPRDANFIRAVCNGERPQESDDIIPDFYIDLMKECWRANPQERPSAKALAKILGEWRNEEFKEYENRRKAFLRQKGINPNSEMKPAYKMHPQAIYTSRFLKIPAIPNGRIPRREVPSGGNDKKDTVVRDASFFGPKSSVREHIKKRKTYPEPGSEPWPKPVDKMIEEDEDIQKQYELSIPFEGDAFDS